MNPLTATGELGAPTAAPGPEFGITFDAVNDIRGGRGDDVIDAFSNNSLFIDTGIVGNFIRGGGGNDSITAETLIFWTGRKRPPTTHHAAG